MKEYDLNDTNIISIPDKQNIALYTNDLHVWYGDNEAIKGVGMEFEKIKLLPLSVLLAVENLRIFAH